MYHTIIQSNGSRWAGESPATLAELLEVMGRHQLDPSFNNCECLAHRAGPNIGTWDKAVYPDLGPIYPDHPDTVRFWGNFFDVSHVFSIDTDDPEVMVALRKAIANNRAKFHSQTSRFTTGA